MKKTFLIIIILVLTAVIFFRPKQNELILGEYTDDSGSVTLSLLPDNEFFISKDVISYVPQGKYTVENGRLKLIVDENNAFLFLIEREKLIFQSGEWLERFIKKGTEVYHVN